MRFLSLIVVTILALQADADVTVTTRGLTMHVQATDASVAADGLPVITKVRDAQGRLSEVQANVRTVLAYRRDANGRLTGIDVGDSVELRLEPLADRLQATLRAAGGRVLHSATLPASYGTRVPETLRLDLLRDERIAPERQWKVNREGSLRIVTDRQGAPLYYAVIAGTDRVVFDREGKAILYDLDLLGLVDQGPASAMFFSRLVLAANGDLEVLAPFAPAGAVLAMRVVNGEITYELLHDGKH